MKIIFTTFRQLPVTNPAADAIRFSKLTGFLSKKYQPTFLSPGTTWSFSRGEYQDKPHYQLPSKGSGYVSVTILTLLAPWYLKKIIRRENPDVIFVNSIFYSLATNTAKKHNVTIHLDIMGLDHVELKIGRKGLINSILAPIIRALEINLIKKADFITCVNEAHAAILRTLTEKPVYVLRDGVEIEDTPPPNTLQENRLLFVGSLAHRRLDELFEALDTVFSTNPDITLTIAGDGPDRKYYENIATKKQYGERVQFLGYIPHEKVMELIRTADICYSDDWSEIGFPTKVFEYMAAGKALVVQETQAVKEIIEDGKDGITYNGPTELAESILLLMHDKDLRAKIGAAAYAEVSSKHQWNHREEELLKIYESLTRE